MCRSCSSARGTTRTKLTSSVFRSWPEARSYDELEKECQRLTQLNDAPVWSIGTYRGVISKIDLLYAIAGAVTPDDLNRYFSMARMVLGEDDPALDLDEDQRWAASIHGKTREFSAAFREGISETLVLLAVHGRHLFKRPRRRYRSGNDVRRPRSAAYAADHADFGGQRPRPSDLCGSSPR